jgi:predicted small secreted protein
METLRKELVMTKWFWIRGLVAVTIAIGGISLTGCNTVEGAGEDIEAAGQGIEDAAE